MCSPVYLALQFVVMQLFCYFYVSTWIKKTISLAFSLLGSLHARSYARARQRTRARATNRSKFWTGLLLSTNAFTNTCSFHQSLFPPFTIIVIIFILFCTCFCRTTSFKDTGAANLPTSCFMLDCWLVGWDEVLWKDKNYPVKLE